MPYYIKHRPNLLDSFVKTKMHKVILHNKSHQNTIKKTCKFLYEDIYAKYLQEYIIVILIVTSIIIFLLFRVYYKYNQDKYKIVPKDIDFSEFD